MEIADLKVFATVVEEGTTIRAAKSLGMTQPGVSKHLARLEQEVGGALFERKGKYLVLNEFGEFFLEQSRKILKEIDALAACTYGSLCPVGSLRLGFTDSATMLVTPPSLTEFRTRYPGIHIALEVESSTRIEEGVLSDKYDLGFITAGLQSHPLLQQETLYDDCIDAVVSRDHELARRKRVPLQAIAEHTLIISPRRRRTRAIIDKAFHSQGIPLKDVIDVYVHSAAMRFAENGLGVALLPRMFITREIHRHRCAHIRIAGDPIHHTMCIVRRRDQELSEAARCFHTIVMQHKRILPLKAT